MDVVVTVPKNFKWPAAPGLKGLAAWIAEGDAAGEPETGVQWDFSTWGFFPKIEPGERVYVVCEDRLRGYAPLVRVEMDFEDGGEWGVGYLHFIRKGGAVAVTIPGRIVGFRGWRYRWWKREDEVKFPDWKGRPEPDLFAEKGGAK